jgi:hypothetical protein
MRVMNTQSDTSLSRTLRCPKCHQQFETMRRFRVVCTECGHEWEEVSVLTREDRIADAREELGQTLVMGFMWAGLICMLTVLVGSLIYGAVMATGQPFFGFILGGLFVLCGGGAIFFKGAFHHREAAIGRVFWWRSIEHPQQPDRRDRS